MLSIEKFLIPHCDLGSRLKTLIKLSRFGHLTHQFWRSFREALQHLTSNQYDSKGKLRYCITSRFMDKGNDFMRVIQSGEGKSIP